jgi:hypothetical protein
LFKTFQDEGWGLLPQEVMQSVPETDHCGVILLVKIRLKMR